MCQSSFTTALPAAIRGRIVYTPPEAAFKITNDR